MRRKQYASATERRRDLGIGVAGCVVVNAVLWLLLNTSLLPTWIFWAINLGMLGLLALFRPYAALGWLVPPGVLLAVMILVDVCLLTVCLPMVAVGLVAEASDKIVPGSGIVAGFATAGLIVVGLVYLVRFIARLRDSDIVEKTAGDDSETESLPEQAREGR